MAAYSSILTWRIPWTEEPGGLWFMRFHNEADRTGQLNNSSPFPPQTSLSIFFHSSLQTAESALGFIPMVSSDAFDHPL